MTTIEELAQTIRQTHDIDSMDAARDVVQVTVDQISDDPDLYDRESRSLTAEGVEVVTTSIAQSYAYDLHGTEAANLIALIGEAATAVEEAAQLVLERTAQRDELIRSALRTELPRGAIAEAANVQPARLYQIRDGRR